MTEDEKVERVAVAIWRQTVSKAQRETAHVVPWDKLPKYWHDIHRANARAAMAEIAAIDAEEQAVALW